MPAPVIEYGQLSPMLIVLAAALAGVLVEAFLPSRGRYRAQLAVSLGALIAAFAAVVVLGTNLHAPGRSVAMGAIAIDGPTLFLQGTLLLIGFLAVMLISERAVAGPDERPGGGGRRHEPGWPRGFDAFTPQGSAIPGSVVERDATRTGVAQTEVFPLAMLALGGMLVLPAANDLLTVFVALELVSLPLYLLCGLARHRRLMSQEAALKYFLLGAFSSGFFLYGMALLYGYAGTLSLAGIGAATGSHSGSESMALVGVGLLTVGLLFKVGAVPFQSWVPDVYQGAPTPITAFMASATKVAAFGSMLRIFYVGLPGLAGGWRPVLSAVAILTMVVGTLMTVSQTDMKRLVGYSSIANAGFILTGVVAANDAGLSSTMFYLVAYGFGTLGAFAVIGVVRNGAGEATDMARWAGLGRQSPMVAGVFALFLLAIAGIPLTSGFVSKFVVFKAAAQSGTGVLVLVAVASSAVAAFAYLRVIGLMFFTGRPEDGLRVVVPSPLTSVAVAVGAVVTVVLGIVPQPLLDLADSAAQFLH
jgi:NADH-quinone oxidoreductase subunit N